MRAARFKISEELLAQLLKLPPAARVIGATYDWPTLSVEFVVDDPSLPEADQPHRSEPIITAERHHWDWNVQP